jgi:hypothetical protein
MKAFLSMGGFTQALADLEYLQANLPSDDPRVAGVQALLEIVRKATVKPGG